MGLMQLRLVDGALQSRTYTAWCLSLRMDLPSHIISRFEFENSGSVIRIMMSRLLPPLPPPPLYSSTKRSRSSI